MVEGKGVKRHTTTVKELIEALEEFPEDATVYHVDTMDGEPQDTYFAVTHVFEQDGAVMIF